MLKSEEETSPRTESIFEIESLFAQSPSELSGHRKLPNFWPT